MRESIKLLLATAALLGVVYLAVGVNNAPLPNNPMAALGVGLIGLGLIRRGRERRPERA